ncbi:MAG TPA: hypothetical protein PLW37_10130, partial [bacterium]|nr:hypothetical protein [bacterium]
MKKIFMVLLFLFAVSCDVRDSGEFLGGDDKKDDENNVKPDTNQTVDDNEKPDEIEEQKPVCGDSKVEGTEVCDTGEKPCSE